MNLHKLANKQLRVCVQLLSAEHESADERTASPLSRESRALAGMETGRAAAAIDLLVQIVTALLTALASRRVAGATLAVSTSVSHRGFLGSSLQVRPCASDCMMIFLSTDCDAPLPISHPHFGSGASSLQNRLSF